MSFPVPDYVQARKIAIVLGIKFEYMTVFHIELIYLRNDGLKYKDIAKMLGSSADNVCRWITREARPSNAVIEKLEHLYQMRRASKLN